MNIQECVFRECKIKSIEGSYAYLAPEKLHKSENLQLAGGYTRLQKTKDAFLSCCYARLRYSDLANLTPTNIAEFHQEIWITYKSVEAGMKVCLPLYLLFEGEGIQML